MEKIYKISVAIPKEYVKELTEKVNSAMTQIYPGYDMVFSMWEAEGMWRPLEGSDPYNGETGKITKAKETIVQFAVKEEDLQRAIGTVVQVHPYEEPAIDVIPIIPWKSVTGCSR
ncbi:MAG: hypothetical protein ACOX8L_04035 [Candidatus Methanomethylophilaceae archaeon]|jgi:hypothetical protein